MIIHIYPYMTLKAPPINNRSVHRSCGRFEVMVCTPKECPIRQVGRPLQGRDFIRRVSGGATHTPAIER